MVIIRKKKIIIVFSLLLFCLSIGLMVTNTKEETIATVSLPVSNKTIVLDAGHGTPDEGDFLLTLNNNN